MEEESNDGKKAWSSIKHSISSFVEWKANRIILATVSLKKINNYTLYSNVEVIPAGNSYFCWFPIWTCRHIPEKRVSSKELKFFLLNLENLKIALYNYLNMSLLFRKILDTKTDVICL
jgi:hypothetical protein